MTAQQAWQQSSDPWQMLEWAQYHHRDAGRMYMNLPSLAQVTVRRLRLIACACVRTLWDVLCDQDRAIVIRAEQIADRGVTLGVFQGIEPLNPSPQQRLAFQLTRADYLSALQVIVWAAAQHNQLILPLYADVFRNIIGDPWHPLRIDPVWRTDTVMTIARGMDQQGDYSGPAFAQLWDALVEAGAIDYRVQAHCSTDARHWRGDHLLDALLEKS